MKSLVYLTLKDICWTDTETMLSSNFLLYPDLWLQKFSVSEISLHSYLFSCPMSHSTLYEGHSIWIAILHMDLPFSQQNRPALPFTGIRENRKKVCLDYLKTFFSFFYKYSNQTWVLRNKDGAAGFWYLLLLLHTVLLR